MTDEQLDIEVLHLEAGEGIGPLSPARWVVRVFGGDPDKYLAREVVRGRAVSVAAALAKVFATGVVLGDEVLVPPVNASGKCELIVRRLDGSIGERRTYPRSKDPAKSRG